MERDVEYQCEKCKDTGKIIDEDGTIHTCWDCLAEGRMNQHSKQVKDSGVKV